MCVICPEKSPEYGGDVMKKVVIFALVMLCFGAVLIAGCTQQGPADADAHRDDH